MNLAWLLIEVLVIGFGIYELISLRRADRAARRAERDAEAAGREG